MSPKLLQIQFNIMIQNGNTLFEGVCIRMTLHCHKHDITPVMNMKESL